jgi:hypothetical protein
VNGGVHVGDGSAVPNFDVDVDVEVVIEVCSERASGAAPT